MKYTILVNWQEKTISEQCNGETTYRYGINALAALVETYSRKGLTVTIKSIA